VVTGAWYEVPGGVHYHATSRDLRVIVDGDELHVEAYDRHHRLPAADVRVEGEIVRLSAVPSPRWRPIGVVATLDQALDLGAAWLLSADLRADALAEIARRERDARRGVRRDRGDDRDEVRELRARLDDPARLVAALGLDHGARRQAGGGVMVLCPAPDHADRTPSCSVRVGRDRTIACRCHACGWTGDALSLIAAVEGRDLHRDFPRVLARAAEIAGVTLRRAS